MRIRVSKYNFQPRHPKLFSLAGDYGSFQISCKHKDILRCSKSKHFRSCYTFDGINKHVPYKLCTKANIGILGKKDRSGDWLWRAFFSLDPFENRITMYRIYGNGYPNHENGFPDTEGIKQFFLSKEFTSFRYARDEDAY